MARRARWIRLGAVDARRLRAARDAFATVQGHAAAPIVLWAATEDARGFHYALIARTHIAPGCAARWIAWALSPAIAAYRDFGLRAYLDGSDVWLQGCRIGGGEAGMAGECVAITACLDLVFASAGASAGAPEFRAWLREGLGLATSEWRGADGAPAERVFEQALRARIEAQHGWQFDTSWPSAAEQPAASERAARLEA